MLFDVLLVLRFELTELTFVGFLAAVLLHVLLQVVFKSRRIIANVAAERLSMISIEYRR